jgi:hypothetical protein
MACDNLALKIANYCLHDPEHLRVQLSQTAHRLRLVNAWAIAAGARLLELGCGQGDCTAVLAESVGPCGHVDAVDPARGDHGAPHTLAEAQAHLSTSAVGDRITFHRAEPVEFLAARPDKKWDAAVLAHCIWYFQSATQLKDVLAALRGRVQRVHIAEYALRATEPAAVPHVLAALARGALEAHKGHSVQNIRTPLSPAAIVEIAEEAGWAAENEEGTLVPEAGLLDGSWEAGAVVGPAFLEEVDQEIVDERVRILLRSAREATIAAAEAVGGVDKVRTMDVWYANLR